MRRTNRLYRSLQNLSVGLTFAALALTTGCGAQEAQDTLNRGQDAVDNAQQGASKAQDAVEDVQESASALVDGFTKLPTSPEEVENLAKKAGKDYLERDAELTGKSQCSKGANDTVKLNKLVSWEAGPYYAVLRYNKTSSEGPFSAPVPGYIYKPLNNSKVGDPRNDWSVECSMLPVGYVEIRFYSGDPNLGQATEQLVLTVKP